jgi:hypothetical protein
MVEATLRFIPRKELPGLDDARISRSGKRILIPRRRRKPRNNFSKCYPRIQRYVGSSGNAGRPVAGAMQAHCMGLISFTSIARMES